MGVGCEKDKGLGNRERGRSGGLSGIQNLSGRLPRVFARGSGSGGDG